MKFLKGLPYCIAEECLCPPRSVDFTGLVQRAQDTVSLYADMKQLYGDRNWQGGQNQNWRSQGQWNQGKPQWQNRNQQRPTNQGSFGPQQYNFSNAPQRFNNTPVAMDMSTDHNRMDHRWNPRAGWGPQANVASTDHPFKGKCFNCEKEGHIARECTAPKCSYINMAQIDDWATFEEGTQDSTYSKEDDHLTSSIRAFTNLSLQEKQEFVARMNQELSEGEQQDFQKALIRTFSSECVYLSNHQSLSIQVFLHTSSKRAKATALLDSGATENIISEQYTKWLCLPFKHLNTPRPIYNVDRMPNKQGNIQFFTDLEVQTRPERKMMRFFLMDLGLQRIILGYPWFAASQPKIDWAKGWMDYKQLPVVLQTLNSRTLKILPWNTLRTKPRETIYVGYVAFPTKGQTMASKLAKEHDKPNVDPLPEKYKWHAYIISEKESQCFPGPWLWDHAIELKKGAPATIPGKIYALMQVEQETLTKFIDEHLKKGYIKPSKSLYASPFFFIKKKDGKLQPVQDYQKVNEWTIKNWYPLPLIPKLIARVKGVSLFTKFNVRWGYNNVHIKDRDQWKAAFITNQGLFEPNVMFFGLINSLATFQTMMNMIFEEELRARWLTIYMDDMLIHTKNDLPLHPNLVHQVLDKLKHHDLFLKPEKWLFEWQIMEFLEVVLENGTIRMDPTKVKGVVDWPQPQTVKDIWAFLGFTEFYRYFVPNYSVIARPLIELTKKASIFHWDKP